MKVPDLFKPAMALVIITITAAVLLGYVHTKTLKPIADQQLKIETEALGVIFNTALDSRKQIDIPENSPITRAYQVYGGGKLKGYAIFTSPAGYSGPVDMVVGIDTAGVVLGIRILRHTETPGLGSNAENPAFTEQFKGKSGMLKVTKAAPGSDEIQAITSATITSNAVTNGVNDALRFFWQLQSN